MLEEKKIDKTVPIPLYFQLKKLIIDEIDNGTYPVDTLIPTEKELGEMFDISRTTVRQAIIELVQEGRLYRIKSKGTFVAKPKVRQTFFNRYHGMGDEIRAKGGVPSAEVLALEVVDMPGEFAKLRDTVGEKAIYLYWTHCYNGEAFVHTETYIPYEGYEHVLQHDFSKEGFYRVLAAENGRRVERLARDFEAVEANSKDAEILKVKKGSPIHYFRTLGYTADDELVEMTFARYRGDRHIFHVDMMISDEYKE